MTHLENALAQLRICVPGIGAVVSAEGCAALLGEIDRLTAEVQRLRAERAGWRSIAGVEEVEAERDEAVRRWHDEHKRAESAEAALAKALSEAEDWRGVAAKRKADREQLVAAILRLKQQPGISRDAWFAYAGALEMARGTRIELRGPRADAESAAGASVMDFPPEAPQGPQEPAEGFEWTPDGRLYVNGPPCRHDHTLLVQTETGWVCMVCGPTQAPESVPVPVRRRTPAERAAYLAAQRDDAIARGLPPELIDDMIADAQAEIAPEDEGIATSDVMAQIAADNESERPRDLYGPTGHSSPDAAHYALHGTLADGTYPRRDTIASLKPTDDESEPQ